MALRLASRAIALCALAACTDTDGLTGGQTDPDAGDGGGNAPPVGTDAGTDAAPDGPVVRTYESEVRADDPIAYYRFDEQVTPKCVDATGHGNDGTYTGAITLGAPGAIANDANPAIAIADGYIDMGDRFAFPGTEAFSIEAWVKVGENRSHAIAGRYASGSAGPPGGHYVLLTTQPAADGGLAATITFGRVPNSLLSTAFANAAWHHVVVTFDSVTMRIYRDAVEVGVAASSATIAAPPPFLIGKLSTNGFGGSMDEFAVYDKVLPASRIAAHYRVGIGQPP